MRQNSFRSAFTMIEVFAVVMLISLLVMLLLPAVQSARELARRTSCANNLMQVSLAVHAYHHAFDQLPTQLSGTDGSPQPTRDNDRRLSLLVALLPYLAQQELEAEIATPLTVAVQSTSPMVDGMMMGNESWMRSDEDSEPGTWVAGGPEPFQKRYPPWNVDVPPFRCPSDPGIGYPSMGRNNYAVCLGDAMVASNTGPLKEVDGHFVFDAVLAEQTSASMRGMFVPRVVTRMTDITDGLAQTIMFGEIATDLGDLDVRTSPAVASQVRDQPSWAIDNELRDPERPLFWTRILPWNTGGEFAGGDIVPLDQDQRRGYRWADGMPIYTAFNTILPPNREIVLVQPRDDSAGILTASSRHQGGVHVSLADASVQFITDSIDAGDSREPTVYPESANPPGSPSPYGLWGALGTRAEEENVTLRP